MNEYMKMTEENLLHTYNRFPITLDRGDGVYLYDTDGKKYLDFAAGIYGGNCSVRSRLWECRAEKCVEGTD